MEIILLERVENLGQVGDKVSVKPGYARNYLLPRKKALRATKENIAFFDAQKATIEAENVKKMEQALDTAKKMDGLTVYLVRQAAETGQLYGSVTGRDVRDLIAEQGYEIERKQVDLQVAIKNIGSYNISLKLHPDVSQVVKVNIGRSMDEAKKLATASKKADADMMAVAEAKDAKKASKEDAAE